VDGFNKDYTTSEAGKCGERGIGLVATQRDALKSLQLSHCLLDPRTQPVEPLGEEPRLLLGGLSSRNDWRDLARSGGLPIEPAVIPFVGNRHARRDVWTEIERSLELRGIAYFAAGQVEIEWITVEVGLEVDFR
jgi:hypothetical protein